MKKLLLPFIIFINLFQFSSASFDSTCITISKDISLQSRDVGTSENVHNLQYFLNQGKYLVYYPDGYFGTSTLTAVKQFQNDYSILPTGYVGSVTRAKIHSLSCKPTTVLLNNNDINTVVAATYGTQTKTSGCLANQILQDSACSPGAVLTTDPKIICVSGYTKTVRNVTEATKKKVFAEYGIPYSQRSNYEVDHIISLELGGSNDISNLYPESYLIKNGAKTKDIFENYLHKQICNGSMEVSEAQRQISSDWFYYYQTGMLHLKIATTTQSITKPTKVTTSKINISNVVVPVAVITQAVAKTNTVNTITGPEVKKSKTNICHARGTTYYERTTNYTSYNTVDECLKSGGRLPK